MTKGCCRENSKETKGILRLNEFLRIISDVNRLRILCLLTKGERCVCEIFEALKLPQNLVSHHLAKLKKLLLVDERREGTFVVYSINRKALKQYKALFNQIIRN
ncbi:MAG: metalloregulator ArsR/SmtB family transcription factor [Parcubacteria group bacterium]|jgi:ArsR family transcriptional regulator